MQPTCRARRICNPVPWGRLLLPSAVSVSWSVLHQLKLPDLLVGFRIKLHALHGLATSYLMQGNFCSQHSPQYEGASQQPGALCSPASYHNGRVIKHRSAIYADPELAQLVCTCRWRRRPSATTTGLWLGQMAHLCTHQSALASLTRWRGLSLLRWWRDSGMRPGSQQWRVRRLCHGSVPGPGRPEPGPAPLGRTMRSSVWAKALMPLLRMSTTKRIFLVPSSRALTRVAILVAMASGHLAFTSSQVPMGSKWPSFTNLVSSWVDSAWNSSKEV